jgi:hypothetical protein
MGWEGMVKGKDKEGIGEGEGGKGGTVRVPGMRVFICRVMCV